MGDSPQFEATGGSHMELTNTTNEASSSSNTNYYAKLSLGVRSVKVPVQRSSEIYIKMKIGPVSFQTPRRPLAGPWEDSFDFRINMHAHLFYTLQVDVYEYRMLLPSFHIGRAEIRLARLDSTPGTSTNWFNLRHRKNCYIHLHELKIRDPELEEDLTGRIELEISYIPAVESTPMIKFIGCKEAANISAIKLTSIEPEPSSSSAGSPIDNNSAVINASTRKEMVLSRKGSLRSGPTGNRIFDPAVATDTADSRALGQPEVISLFKRVLGYVMSNEEYFAMRNFLDMATTFGQGIEIGSSALLVGFVLLQKFFRDLPKEFGNNLVLRKKDLELPRVMYRYTMGTLGWRGLNFLGKGQGIISDSMRSEADLKTVLEFLNLPKTDLLIFELGESRMFRPNFFVALDRGLSAVILSIRGTMSLSDGITDFACEYIRYRGGMVHSGFFEAARWFMENVCGQLLDAVKKYDLENIYICGHSLGGSTSALTTMLLVDTLRNEPNSWPKTSSGKPLNIHCYAYGMAPVITRELCEDYLQFIDVYIYGDDIVPRMSYGSFIDFQILMVYAGEIGHAHHVFKESLSSSVCDKVTKCHTALRMQHPQMNLKLYIPGQIHHLMKLKAPSKKHYTIIDTCTCDRFVELQVGRKMLAHHMPAKYEKALEDAYLVLLEEEIETMDDNLDVPTAQEHLQEAVEAILTDNESALDDDDDDDNLDCDSFGNEIL